MMIRLKNTNILSADNTLVPSEILIHDGRIIEIDETIEKNADQTIDCEHKLLLPGFVDIHVHLREPGNEHKETIATGSQAAARGGFTTICAMPNTNPAPDTCDRVRHFLDSAARDAIVRVLTYGSITKDLKGQELTAMQALSKGGVCAFTDDGVGVQSAGMMLQAMKKAAHINKPIVAHCEDNTLVYGGVVHDNEVAERLNLPGLSGLSESVQIARDVLLAEQTGCHYHVCHVSSKESVRVIRDAKKACIHVTAEVTPHHLLLNESDIETADPNFKMNPPLRNRADQVALLEGLKDGTIDCIATDHAPHADYEKAQSFLTAPFGIIGLETAFPLLYTKLVKPDLLSLQTLVAAMTMNPATVFDLPYGQLALNRSADLTLIDLKETYQIDTNHFASLGRNSPFHGWEVTGRSVWTMVEGQMMYSREGL